MEQTNNYGLSQWDEQDRILREDFNADNAKIEAALASAGNCKIVAGSYKGAGVYGADTPNTLTFDSAPLAVFVIGSGKQMTLIREYPQAMVFSGASSYPDILTLTWAHNTVRWHHNVSAPEQLNASTGTYYYVALLSANSQ